MPLTRTRALAASVLVLLIAPALLAPFASAGSHSRLTVALWNDDSLGLGAGDSFDVWAQVFDGQTPVNVSAVTFYLGVEFPPFSFAVPYTGNYAGTPGLYTATVNVSAQDQLQGITILSVEATQGPDTAISSRFIILQIPGGGPFGGGGGPWSVHVGVDNLAELGGRVLPGDEVVWRIDTALDGNATNASTLTADLFVAPHVTFTEASVPLTPINVATGVYEVRTAAPANPPESLEMVVQAHVTGVNDAWSNGTADIWFHDTIANFSVASNLRLTGSVTVGDGVSVEQGLSVALEVVEDGNASHSIGWIAGTTDAAGQVPFDITNDGTTSLLVDGWVNSTTLAQRVYRPFTVRDTFIVPTPESWHFDAVPLADASVVPWEGVQSFPFEFYDNGSLYVNGSVNAYVWNARGMWDAPSLTTDGQGRANISVDFDAAPPFAFEDVVAGGFNMTFRMAQGPDASASDGNWWGEDEEHVLPDPSLPFVRLLVDTNVSFTSQTFTLGSPFGVGAKYTGAASVAGWEGGAALFPGSFLSQVGGGIDRYAVWTGSDIPFVTYLRGGDAQEFYGCAQVPSYWPDTTYSLVGVVVPSISALTSEDGLPASGALWWTDISVGGQATGFVPSADTTPPEVVALPDLFGTLGQPLDLSATVYDNSLGFCGGGNYTWSFDDPNWGVTQAWGATASVMLPSAGVIAANLTVTDGSGNFAVVNFTVTISDNVPPTVDAGPDQAVLVGDVVSLNATAADNDAAFPAWGSFDWTFTYNGSLVDLVGANQSFTFDIPGIYNVTLSVLDPQGNLGTDALQVTVRLPDAEPPTVDAGPDQTVRAGDTVAFAGTATDNDPLFPAGAIVAWNFSYNGSVVTLTGMTPTFPFDLPGSYLVSLEVTDGSGNLGVDTVMIEVLPLDTTPPTVDAGADWNVVAGTTVTVLGSATDSDPLWPSGATVAWTFDYGGTPVTISGYAFSFLFDTPGSYDITLTVVDGSGNAGSDMMTVTVIPLDTTAPSIASIPDREVMTDEVVTMAATASDDSANFSTTGRYNWTFTHAGTSYDLSGPSVTFTFTQAEVVQVTLTVRDWSGNAATRMFLVRVRAPDTTAPSITLARASVTAHVGEDVLLSASAEDGGNPISNASAFQWSFVVGGSTVTLTGGQATYRFETPGTYNITLRVTDAAGNVGTAYMEVTIEPGSSAQESAGGLDPMLLVGVLAAVAVVALLGWMMTRKRPPAEPSGQAAGEKDAGEP